MILDLIILAIVALMVFIGIKRGLVGSLYGFAATALSAFLAHLIGSAVAEWVYNTFVYSTFSGTAPAQAQQGAVAASYSQSAIDSMPGYAVGILNNAGITRDNLGDKVNSSALSADNNIVSAINAVVSPIIISAISIILTVVLFIVFRFIFKLISKRILRLFDLPVLRTVNVVLGGILGLAEGLVLCYLGVIVCRLVICINQAPIITQELINQSILFKAAYNSEFVSSIGNFAGEVQAQSQPEPATNLPSVGETVPTGTQSGMR